MPLVACPACARHLRSTEKQCAFCGAEIARASGAVRIAIAAAIVAASAVGCQKEIAQPYGVPIPPNDGRDAAANPMPDVPAAAPDGGK